ncbi:hypothetical protein Br6_05240 [Rhodococcus sp. Br-6]|nr:hypothetical protein Br6_05240 [Rhodococcus sp. Br-6]
MADPGRRVRPCPGRALVGADLVRRPDPNPDRCRRGLRDLHLRFDRAAEGGGRHPGRSRGFLRRAGAAVQPHAAIAHPPLRLAELRRLGPGTAPRGRFRIDDGHRPAHGLRRRGTGRTHCSATGHARIRHARSAGIGGPDRPRHVPRRRRRRRGVPAGPGVAVGRPASSILQRVRPDRDDDHDGHLRSAGPRATDHDRWAHPRHVAGGARRPAAAHPRRCRRRAVRVGARRRPRLPRSTGTHRRTIRRLPVR